MRIPLLILLLVSIALPAFCQVATVMDAATGRPLPGATISSKKPIVFVVTGPDGRADISDFRDSEAIEIRSAGHSTALIPYDSIVNAGLEIRLLISTVALGQVVISASGWEEDKRKVSRYIVPIKKETVAFLNPQTTADLLGTSGSVFIQKSQQGGGSPMIRGFATSRLLYSVDGVRMNTAIFRSGNIQNVISLDPFAIESAEVLFGPGSVVYGSDAIGGVMRFETLKPKFSETDKVAISGNAALRFSSANEEQTAHLDLNIGLKKWAFLTSVSNFNFDDLRMGTDGPESYLRNQVAVRGASMNAIDIVVDNPTPLIQIPTNYNQVNIMQKVRFKPNDKLDFQYAFHFSETSSFARYDRLLRKDENGDPVSVEWNYGPQLWIMNHLQTTYSGRHALFDEVAVKLAHQQFGESRSDRSFNDSVRRTREESVQAYSANVDFAKSLGQTSVYYGAEWVRNDVESTGSNLDIITGENMRGPARYPNSDWSSAGIYASARHSITERLTLNAGARYNFFGLNADFTNNTDFFPLPFDAASTSDGNVTGSLGLAYQARPNLTLSVLGATGFRSPNVDDIGKIFDSEQGAVVVPNPDLKAEYVYNAEVGVAWEPVKSLTFNLAAYYSYLANAMVRRDFSLGGRDSIVYDGTLSRVQAIQNAARATVMGFQVSVDAKLESGITFESQFNYQRGEEESDGGEISPSRHAAPTFGITRLGFERGPVKVQVFAVYSAEVSFQDLNLEERGKPEIYDIDADGNPFSPSWYTLNFKMSWTFDQGIMLSAGVENITDQRYRPYSSGIAGAGRNVVLSLRANF